MKLLGVNKVHRCPFKGTVPVTRCSFCFIIVYNNLIIKHIKQKGMIRNKTCQLDKG